MAIVEKSRDVVVATTKDLMETGTAITKTTADRTIRIDPLSEEGDIVQKIAATEAEKCPDYAKSPMAKRVWEMDREKRLLELRKKMK